MPNFEILCVTMHQKDFSKIEEMNIHSDVFFANQADTTAYQSTLFEGHIARMITTDTRGVGINRNLALTYARGDICLFADDDVRYIDNLEETVVGEFERHPDADVMIFHLDTDDPHRKQKRYPTTRKCTPWERMPWGGFRIAVRLQAVRKANLWFTTLFGGGCIFPSGEDSMWLTEAKRKGLTFYVSKETIGIVSFETSTWFNGLNKHFYWGRGAYQKAIHPRTCLIWIIYMAIRLRENSELTFWDRVKWMKRGCKGYEVMQPFDSVREML